MPESIGQFYPTQVPSYTEAADIRKAFNLYHYGTETVPTNEGDILSDSVAGYIRDTLAAVEAAQIGETVIQALDASTNLNDLTASGIYKSTSSPTTALNYPSTSNGILTYYQTSDNTFFQTYLSLAGAFWWRYATQPQATRVWSAWQKAALENHTHDTRYYTQSQINAKITSTPTASRVAVIDSSGQIVSSTTTTDAEIEYLAGTTDNIQTQLDAKSDSGHNHNSLYYQKTETAKVTVSSTQPTSPSVGDLWFY